MATSKPRAKPKVAPLPEALKYRGKKAVEPTATKPPTPLEEYTTKPAPGQNSYAHAIQMARNGSEDKPLTTTQALFAKLWASGESIRVAGIKAGFKSAPSAYVAANMPAVRKRYEAEKRLYEEAAQMSRKKVMDMLVEAYDMAKLMAEPASMVGAAREIGKMCGYYAPVKHKITIDGSSQKQRMERMSDEELEKLIGGKLPDDLLDTVKDAEHARGIAIEYNGPIGADLAAEEFDFDADGDD